MTKLPKDVERRLAKLDALEAGGVDNWDWYDESLKDYRATIGREETAENILRDILGELCVGVIEPAGRGCGYGFTDDSIKSAVEILLHRYEELK